MEEQFESQDSCCSSARGKARWEYTEPERKLFVSDGKNAILLRDGPKKNATKAAIKESVDPQIPFYFCWKGEPAKRLALASSWVSGERPIKRGNVVLKSSPSARGRVQGAALSRFHPLLMRTEAGDLRAKRGSHGLLAIKRA